jgi:hypothetical protein
MQNTNKYRYTIIANNRDQLLIAGRSPENKKYFLLTLNLDRVRKPLKELKGWTRRAVIGTLDTPSAHTAPNIQSHFKHHLKKHALKMLSAK